MQNSLSRLRQGLGKAKSTTKENAINPVTGKKLRILLPEYRKMKDEVNRLGKEYGYTKTEYRKRAEHSRTQDERHIILKGGASWKEELRTVIEAAKQVSSTQEEFIDFLKDCGVTITRSKTEYSYLHPQKQKAIRGLKLGENYCKEKIDEYFKDNKRRTDIVAVGKNTGNEQRQTSGLGEFAVEGSVGAVERELQRFDKQ
ncbi:MAG: relaxase/mobilization nuclease domain-containing protein, partial [Clostridia bacterium]|nr:relaxase/mobilization nuclease domain-containing protein [Clostridia bacterium]